MYGPIISSQKVTTDDSSYLRRNLYTSSHFSTACFMLISSRVGISSTFFLYNIGLSSFDIKYTDRLVDFVEYFLNTISICIRNEYLSEFVIRNHLHQLSSSFVIQFIKDIIQQKQRFKLILFLQISVLC